MKFICADVLTPQWLSLLLDIDEDMATKLSEKITEQLVVDKKEYVTLGEYSALKRKLLIEHEAYEELKKQITK